MSILPFLLPNEFSMQNTNTSKHLGGLFNNKLCFKDHIKYIREKDL